jgi:hypothetical protein
MNAQEVLLMAMITTQMDCWRERSCDRAMKRSLNESINEFCMSKYRDEMCPFCCRIVCK